MSFYSEIIAPSGAYKAYINGEWRESSSGKTVAINNPTTEGVAYNVQGAAKRKNNAEGKKQRCLTKSTLTTSDAQVFYYSSSFFVRSLIASGS